MKSHVTLEEHGSNEAFIDGRYFLTWIFTALLFYSFLSGVMIWLLPFGVMAQYSVLLHAVVGLLAIVPTCWMVFLHWQRRKTSVNPTARSAAYSSTIILVACLLSGLIIILQATVFTRVSDIWSNAHLVTGLLFGIGIIWHLSPILLRYRYTEATARRPARRRFVAIGAGLVAVLVATNYVLVFNTEAPRIYQAFSDGYEAPFGDDRPFWPSRAVIHEPPWQESLRAAIEARLDSTTFAEFNAAVNDRSTNDAGFISRAAAALDTLQIPDHQLQNLNLDLARAREELRTTGALVPSSMTGSAGCGASGCHEEIYAEWQPSAHGFSATDVLYLQVQQLLIDSGGVAQTRACAGCHDPVALLSGARVGHVADRSKLDIYEGNSCIVCHSINNAVTVGNGAYTLTVPERYLFEQSESWLARVAGQFLIRSYSDHHVSSYKRPLYKTSEFCAACHKQTPTPGLDTSAGLAQEQNEYDSWKMSKWYHDDDESLTIECRECHMPLVVSNDPGRGDALDDYRSSGDGKHRSHRVLGSNMYIPTAQGLPGGEEQAQMTIAWLRGEIEVPEINYKWTTGPVVEMRIDAPDSIQPDELINIKLHLTNRKTGHEFPAGPLDVLESWVELKVEDDNGNVLLLLGDQRSVNPTLDAPIVYKADWYDRQGLPVERHNLWEVVGASYKRTIGSNGQDTIDIPFRCPGIARPRLSDSVAEAGPGERNTDVVLSMDTANFNHLTVTATLLFRKANPEFLANVYGFDPYIEAPAVEIALTTHRILISAN